MREIKLKKQKDSMFDPIPRPGQTFNLNYFLSKSFSVEKSIKVPFRPIFVQDSIRSSINRDILEISMINVNFFVCNLVVNAALITIVRYE